MDSLIVAEKIESLRRCIQRIEDKRAATAEQLGTDLDRQDILGLNLTRAVQLCVDIAAHLLADRETPAPQSMGEVFTQLAETRIIPSTTAERLRAAVGFRNIVVHAYEKINWAIVHAISHEGIEDFRRFAGAVGQLLDRPGG